MDVLKSYLKYLPEGYNILEKPQTNLWNEILKDILVVSLSAITAKTMTAPLERASVELNYHARSNNTNRQSTGLWSCIKAIRRDRGFSSLWAGNLTNIFRYLPVQILNFTINKLLRRLLLPTNLSFPLTLGFNLFAGAASGFISLLLTYPMDYARTLLVVDMSRNPPHQRNFNNLSDCLAKIIQFEGFAGLYSGFSTSLNGVIFYRTLYHGVFESFKNRVAQQGIMMRATFGYIITCFASMITHPLDVARRRVMMRESHGRTGIFDTMYAIWRREGLLMLFAGLGSSMPLRSIGSSIVLVLNDEIHKMMA